MFQKTFITNLESQIFNYVSNYNSYCSTPIGCLFPPYTIGASRKKTTNNSLTTLLSTKKLNVSIKANT